MKRKNLSKRTLSRISIYLTSIEMVTSNEYVSKKNTYLSNQLIVDEIIHIDILQSRPRITYTKPLWLKIQIS